MRKGKRFTPERLNAWVLKGRGTGVGAAYAPWHQVTRGDPGSRGRSHLFNWRLGRLHHLLSDHELLIMGFAAMVPGVVDIREQFPLSLFAREEELSLVRAIPFGRMAPGTLELAADLRIRHPRLGAARNEDWWVMSTDFLLTVQEEDGLHLVAVSVKFDDELIRPRARDLLHIERQYWLSQGVPWLLITPATYSPQVALAVRHALPWSLVPESIPKEVLLHVPTLWPKFHGASLERALSLVSATFECSRADAQFLFWGAVWSGALPIDLAMDMHPRSTVRVLTMPDFWSLNPVISRRSSWAW